MGVMFEDPILQVGTSYSSRLKISEVNGRGLWADTCCIEEEKRGFASSEYKGLKSTNELVST
jgi:hypothetical protein